MNFAAMWSCTLNMAGKKERMRSHLYLGSWVRTRRLCEKIWSHLCHRQPTSSRFCHMPLGSLNTWYYTDIMTIRFITCLPMHFRFSVVGQRGAWLGGKRYLYGHKATIDAQIFMNHVLNPLCDESSRLQIRRWFPQVANKGNSLRFS